MALQSVWYYTDLPDKIIDTIEEDLSNNFEALSKKGTGPFKR